MDQEINKWLLLEQERQNNGIELIASENFVSKEIRKLTGSILTNKYAEGYPGKRYYGGCECVDAIEQIAIDRACKLFSCNFANVQPHSGSQANAAAYRALLPRGGKILSLVLNDGGHLTHGSPVSFSSHLYKFAFYPLKDGHLDYDEVERIALEYKPDLILCGYSSYPYVIDFKRFKEIADKVEACLMVDMAHIAGLVATNEHPSPFPYADIVTSTTHKTLRGPRGGLILCNDSEIIKKVNSAIFPYYQGGPLEHVIAAKAVCFKEAMSDDFKRYIQQVKINTKACSNRLKQLGVKVSGTDNHLFLINVLDSYSLTGKEAQLALEEIGITTNKNMIPNDTLTPSKTSGLRIGFAAVTTRGCTKEQAESVADIIHGFLSKAIDKDKALKMVKEVIKSWKLVQEIGE
ncbi:MAG TPA: serine hydroxymethyltransferase [Erysipelotrichaceae bacterium]|nr:serine hydroxymethyltransferase [Erysipelotrichaceae bacterium]